MAGKARLSLLPVALLLAILVALNVATRGFVLLDTYDVLYGSAAASRCLSHGVLSGCPDVNQFALLQYLPALTFHAAGFSLDDAANGLVALNGLAVLGVLVLVATTVTRFAGPAAGAVAAAFVLGSPLLWYAHGGYGEPLGMLAITALATSALLGAPASFTGVAMFFAGISKETAVPFLIAVAVIAWLIRGRRRSLRRGEVVAVVLGGLAAVVANAAFNLFRFGTVFNEYYSNSAFRARPGQAAGNVLALLVSPTGGVLEMWPAVLAVVCAVGLYGFRRRRRREPGLAIAALFVALVVSQSEWYAPLGGTTWGPRLFVPWLPVLLLFGLVAYPERTHEAIVGLIGRPASAVFVCAALVLTGLPHVIVTVDSARYHHGPPGLNADRRELVIRATEPDTVCPGQPRITDNRDYYLHCLRHRTWQKGIAPVKAYSVLSNGLVAVFAAVWTAGVLGLMLFARARVRGQPPTLA
jgi:hypothetical protein